MIVQVVLGVMKYNKQTDHYEAIDCQDAYQLIADKLNSLSSFNEAEFYTSGRASNEASFLYQLFGRILVPIIFLIAKICVTKPVVWS